MFVIGILIVAMYRLLVYFYIFFFNFHTRTRFNENFGSPRFYVSK